MKNENRRTPRFECTGVASVQMTPLGPHCAARILDLSAGGCRIALEKPHRLAKGMKIDLTFNVNHLPFRVWGLVKAIRADRTIGLEFPPMSDRVRERLGELIGELKDRVPARSAGS